MALPLAIGACFTSCKEDTQPRLEIPTEFVLNTPSMADQTYVFRDDENYQNLNDITFTVSQPNYGLGVTPTYYVQLAKSEADFAAWADALSEAKANGEEVDPNEILGPDELPLAYALNLSTQQAVINVDGVTFCDGVNAIYGLDADNYNHETKDVWVRIHASLPNAPQSEIWSNAINIKVSSYIPVKEPGKLYLIGAPEGNGWDINGDQMYLDETGIATGIFYGTLFIPAGQFQFRFYSQLGDWESFSVGSQDADNPIDIEFDADGVYEGPIFMGIKKSDSKGKGSWQDNSWTGGNVEITINTKEMTIVMKKAPVKKVYLVGACNGWNIDSDALYIEENPSGSNIYKGVCNIPAGQFQFRFYTALGNWDENSVGAGEPDEDFNISMASGTYSGSCMPGKGKWNDGAWAGGDVLITLDLGQNLVTFEKQ